MIARYWTARTTKAPEEYRNHFTRVVVPNLQSVPGFQGCLLMEDAAQPAEARFVALTLWSSEDDITAFAGNDITRAHVEPEGQAALDEFDRAVQHYTVSVAVGLVGGETQ